VLKKKRLGASNFLLQFKERHQGSGPWHTTFPLLEYSSAFVLPRNFSVSTQTTVYSQKPFLSLASSKVFSADFLVLCKVKKKDKKRRSETVDKWRRSLKLLLAIQR
jgi:hypothetical protein